MSALKRASPSVDGAGDDANTKRTRLHGSQTKHHHLKYRQPGSRIAVVNSQDTSVIDQQLSRALCVTLLAAGFDSSEPIALASFQEHVHRYMQRFAMKVNDAMVQSRRAKPLPSDFIHALAAFDIQPSSLKPILKHSIPAIVTQQPILLSSSSKTVDFATLTHFDERQNIVEKENRPFVPKHFPNLPAEHAYKETAVYSQRENETRRLRELSANEGSMAEQALRKLVVANRVGLRQRAKRVNKDPDQQRERTEDIWRDALSSLIQEDERQSHELGTQRDTEMVGGLDGIADAEAHATTDMPISKDLSADSAILVNYHRAHWRRGTYGKLLFSSLTEALAFVGRLLTKADLR